MTKYNFPTKLPILNEGILDFGYSNLLIIDYWLLRCFSNKAPGENERGIFFVCRVAFGDSFHFNKASLLAAFNACQSGIFAKNKRELETLVIPNSGGIC